MTWRRKVLLGSLVAGCGIAAFQPIVRNRLEHRLSEVFATRVEIGSSKISLFDSTISLQQVIVYNDGQSLTQPQTGHEIEPTSNQNRPSVQIAQAALKFDWYSVLFRNLKVSNAVATGVDWCIETPCDALIPVADPIAPNSFQSSLQTLDPIPLKKSSETVVNRIIQPLRVFIAEEVAKQSQASFDISNNLRQIVERLDELQPGEANVNPLRQQQQIVLDTIKRELALINQTLADNRIHKRKVESSFTTLKQQSKTNLEKELDTIVSTSKSNSRLQAHELANAAVAKHWNDFRGITLAMKQAIDGLENGINRTSKTQPVVNRSNEGSNVNAIPARITSLLNGKVRGSVRLNQDLPESNQKLDFKLALKGLSNASELDPNQPVVEFTITAPQNQDIPLIHSTATLARIPQSNAIQTEILLERNGLGSLTSRIKTRHSEEGWISWVQIPMTTCLDPSATVGHENNSISAQLIGKTSASWSDAQNMLVELDSKSLDALESQIDKLAENSLTKMRSDVQILGTEQLHNELLGMSSRWDQLSDEHARDHSNWESQVAELNARAKSLESTFKRTSRNSTGTNR